MTKSLGSIAAASLFLAVIFFIAAGMVSRDRHLDLGFSHSADSKPGVRQWAWDGGDRLDVRVPAKVTLMDGAGPAVIVRGPEDMLARLQFRNGRLSSEGNDGDFCFIPFFCDNHDNDGVEVELHGIHPNEIDIDGAAELALGHIEQDSLKLRVSGAGEIEGEGHVGNLDLDISGAGEARLGKLAAEHAKVVVSGAGDVTIAPSEEANVRISGMGHVGLASKPKNLISSISGMGSVDGDAATDNDAEDDAGKDGQNHGQDAKLSGKVDKTVKKALDKARVRDSAPAQSPQPPVPPLQHSENDFQRDFHRQVHEIARREIEKARTEAWRQADEALKQKNQSIE
jgi:hypothetical protein